ncbi:MAG: hypothetical protein Kow0079_02030 [Vicingaceae bacterium]
MFQSQAQINKTKDESSDRHPNSIHFSHWYIGGGFIFGSSEGKGGEVTPLGNNYFEMGFRYKFKIAEAIAIGADVSYFNYWFKLKQDSSKVLPTNDINDKEKLKFNSLILSPYLRIKYKSNGDMMGKFIDLGGYFGYMYKSKHYTYNKHDIANEAGGSNTETYNNNLVFTEDLVYGLNTRIGLGHFILTAKYRLSDLFKEDYIFPELPRFMVGIEVGLHE